MKLERYLADYLHAETAGLDYFTAKELTELIKQGLDAFESTEDVKIVTVPADPYNIEEESDEPAN